MTDPSTALQSFQQELIRGGIQLRPGALDKNLYLYVDNPKGETRFTYVKLKGRRTVTAFVEFATCEPIEGKPCFAIGYAIPEVYRKQGRAKEAVSAAISEMRHGFGRIGMVFYVEAIVGADNKASQHIAEQLISDKPEAITDHISGLPAFRYLLKIEYSNG
ncbi:MAG TPA: GNAT family N-acetyltransferase [Candidatus Sulfotelmatobacter sp.]|nr:GNAT family N-acetyltransferase [Candidatus Sulfotelmatobacter sp.]